MRSVGEILAKVASVALFVVVARELGDAQFGDFIFGISFAQVLLIAAGVGTEELLTREVSRRHERVHELLPDIIAVKGLLLIALWLVMVLIVLIAGYGAESALAILLVGAGVGVEYQTKTYYAVFQALERQQYIASTLIVQRFATAIAGIVAVFAGADLVAVGAIFLLGSVLGLAFASQAMERRVVEVVGSVDRGRWAGILRAGAPLGIVIVLSLILVRLDAALISFLTGGEGNNSELGQYGAAFRLVDATMFVSFAFAGAVFPWFARTRSGGPVALERGLGLALKALLAVLLPIGVLYSLFAPELIDTLYGPEFEGAVTPLRFLGAMTVLFGVNTLISIILIARERPGLFAWPAAFVVAQNLAFNLYLIPRYGADGAAATAVISGVLLMLLTSPRTGRLLGTTSWASVVIAPAFSVAAMVGVFFATSGLPWVGSAVLTVATFPAVFLLAERVFYRDDYEFYRVLSGRIGQRLGISRGSEADVEGGSPT